MLRGLMLMYRLQNAMIVKQWSIITLNFETNYRGETPVFFIFLYLLAALSQLKHNQNSIHFI